MPIWSLTSNTLDLVRIGGQLKQVMFCNVETPNPVLGSPPCNEKCAFMLARDRSALAPGGSVVIAAGVERVDAAVGSWRTA